MSREWSDVLSEHQAVMNGLTESGAALDAIITETVACLRRGCKVYTLGNGGSAADAQHIACELLGRFKIDRLAQAAVAVTTDTSTLTAIGNDLGYDKIFARQLEGLLQSGDIVWMLSTSGNSPNIIEAAKTARMLGVMIVGFTGDTGGKLADYCDLMFRAPHTSSDRIQEAHALAYHYICEKVEEALA